MASVVARPIDVVISSFKPTNLKRIGGDLGADTLDNHGRKSNLGIGHHQDEFLTAVTGRQIDTPYVIGKPVGEFLQCVVTDRRGVGVIDLLEVVDVQQNGK